MCVYLYLRVSFEETCERSGVRWERCSAARVTLLASERVTEDRESVDVVLCLFALLSALVRERE